MQDIVTIPQYGVVISLSARYHKCHTTSLQQIKILENSVSREGNLLTFLTGEVVPFSQSINIERSKVG